MKVEQIGDIGTVPIPEPNSRNRGIWSAAIDALHTCPVGQAKRISIKVTGNPTNRLHTAARANGVKIRTRFEREGEIAHITYWRAEAGERGEQAPQGAVASFGLPPREG